MLNANYSKEGPILHMTFYQKFMLCSLIVGRLHIDMMIFVFVWNGL